VNTCKLCPLRAVVKVLESALDAEWPKITMRDVKPHLSGLDLTVVGGLADKGYTIHDVDVLGKEAHARTMARRLAKAGIDNPVHYAGAWHQESHLTCIKNALILMRTWAAKHWKV